MTDAPTRLKLDRAKQLEIDWPDGTQAVFPLAFLRKHCPCAQCKIDRQDQKKNRLHIMTAGPARGPLTVLAAEAVGNYAIKLQWSDGHGAGIYSFEYLHAIAPKS